MITEAVVSTNSRHVHSRCSGGQVDIHGADTAAIHTGSLGIDRARTNEQISGPQHTHDECWRIC